MSSSAKPNGKPNYYIISSGSSCGSTCDYLRVDVFFRVSNIKVNTQTNTITVNIECGVNWSGSSIGQNGSFDNTPSYINIYINNSLATMSPPINIPVGVDAFYSIETSTTFTNPLNSIRFQGVIYGKGSGGGEQANASTTFNATLDIRIVNAQINIINTLSSGNFIILPPVQNGNMIFIKNMTNSISYISTDNQVNLDNYTNGTITLDPKACIGVVSDNIQWWIISYYGNSFGATSPPNFIVASGASPTPITNPIFYTEAGINKVVSLPNPATFKSSFLTTILSSGVSQTSLTVNANGYLGDNNTGIQFQISGYGGGGTKGNASIFFISDQQKWYIAALQGSEYLDFNNNTTFGSRAITTSIAFTNLATTTGTSDYYQLPLFTVPSNNGQIFVLKKTNSTAENGPVIVVGNSGYFLGSSYSTNNKTALVKNESGQGNTSYEAYLMIQVNTGSNTGYFFLGYYPWLT